MFAILTFAVVVILAAAIVAAVSREAEYVTKAEEPYGRDRC